MKRLKFERIQAILLVFCMLATYMPMQKVYAEGETHSVTYRYSGSLPASVTATLPMDSNLYNDGAKVTPKDPSPDEVIDNGMRYSFEGWTPEGEQTISGADITFTGTWSVEDEDDTGEDDSSEFEDEDSYEPNPPAPASYADDGIVTITRMRQIGGSGTHIASFDKGYGTGICCYHKRNNPGSGSKGYIRELTSSDAYYENIKRAMYWGFYQGDGDSDLSHSFSIHIMLSYWRNGNKSLTSALKSGTSRFKTAEKYCNKLYNKGEVPSNFHIYEWVGTGSARRKQILITYKVVNSGYVWNYNQMCWRNYPLK